MPQKKIAIIGTVGLPANYGGFETLAEYLVRNLNTEFDFTIYCSKKAYDDMPKTYYESKLVYLPFYANGKSSIFYDAYSIIHSLFFADVLLVLGVSGAFVIPFVRLFTNKKILINIDGLEWKREKWGKYARKYLKWQESIAVKYSHEIIVDNQGIAEHVLNFYGLKSNLIAYGGDHVCNEVLQNKTSLKYQLPSRFAFKVCRIEPENNIHVVLEAFCKVTNENIVIIGNWQSNDYGKKLKLKYQDYSNIFLLNPIYDQKLLNEIRSNCAYYIHGHSAGGTNPSLVEAMNLGLPILAFNVNYNKFTMNNLGYYFSTSSELVDLIKNIETLNLDTLRQEVNQLAKLNYTWKKIARKYASLFN